MTAAPNAMLPATMRSFTFEEARLQMVRRDIYHTQGTGYHLIRGFLPQTIAQHLRHVWTDEPPTVWGGFEPLRNRPHYVVGEGPFSSVTEKKSAYMFGLWSTPFDEVTHSIAAAVTQLRNQVEQQPLFRDLLVGASRMMTMYMVAITRNAPEIDVKWHRDEFPDSGHANAAQTRLQATLFLSEYGKDYDGEGFILEDNHGSAVEIGRQLQARPGDLLLWRYYNRHCVGRVTPVEGGIGFVRMLFPLERVVLPPKPKPEVVVPAAKPVVASAAPPAPAVAQPVKPAPAPAAISPAPVAAAAPVEPKVEPKTLRRRLGGVARRLGIYNTLKKMGI